MNILKVNMVSGPVTKQNGYMGTVHVGKLVGFDTNNIKWVWVW